MNDPRWSRLIAGWVLAWMLVGPLAAASPGAMIIGAGAELKTGSGALGLACADLQVAGLVSGQLSGSGNVAILPGGSLRTERLEWSGDWANEGDPKVSGIVDWTDRCGAGESTMFGNNDFNALFIRSETGATRRFDTDSLQWIQGDLVLIGGQNRLRLMATGAGQRAVLGLAPAGSQLVHRVDVSDLDASTGQRLAPGSPALYHAVDSGNNRNWFDIAEIDSVFNDRWEPQY